MKKNNIFKVVCVTLLIAVILTWILPSTYYGTSLVDNGRLQIGIVDLFNYITAIVSYFGYVPLYILAVGGFYGVLYQTNGYRNLLDKVVNTYKGNEWIFLTIVMIVFSVITSVCGLSLGLFFLFPFIITVILLMGYSKTTALLATVGSVCIGFLGTTYSITETAAIHNALKLSASADIVTKLVLLVVGLVILIVNVLVYAKKHKIDEPRKGFLYPETKNPNTKTWPIILVFDLTLLVMILASISWSGVFEITFFDDLLKSLNKVTISDFPIFTKLMGNITSFGNWQMTDLINLVLVATVFVSVLGKVKFNDMLNGFGAGAKAVLRPAFVTSLIYLLIFVAAYHPYVLTITEPILSLTKSFNVVTMSGAALISHLFNVELYYSANSLMPYIVGTFTDTGVYGVIAIIWQATYGLAMLFVPTSAMLVLGLSYLNVSYFRWLKAIWKIVLELLVVLLAIFLILVMI